MFAVRSIPTAVVALYALLAPTVSAAAPATAIHELPHPRVVAHYHPRAGMQFLLQHARYALEHHAHALELDLHMRGSDAVCNHDGPTPESPRLRDVINLIVQIQGQKAAVHGDGRQFFLVLEPKDNNPALFQQVFDILGENLPRLSTAARPGDKPRGITVVVTGAWTKQMRAYFADRLPDLNRRCILENHDYTDEIRNLARDAVPFQWTAIRHPEERGRVNALHSGTDARLKGKYNVRVWGAGPNIRPAFFSGADSVNCDHEQLVPFQDFVRHQEASGDYPSLAVRGDRALLAWRGESSENLYVAVGRAGRNGLSFPRQIQLTAFLSEKPSGTTPAAALLPDGRILIVYVTSGDTGLRYICGKFPSAERFLTFSGEDRRLTSPDGAAIHGVQPAVAVAPDGRVLIVYRAAETAGLRYVIGRPDKSGLLVGAERSVTAGHAADGYSPAVASDGAGRLLLAYGHGVSGQMHALTGRLDEHGAAFTTDTTVSDREGGPTTAAAAAMGGAGNIMIAWSVTGDEPLRIYRGRMVRGGQITGKPLAWSEPGDRPTLAFTGTGRPVLLYKTPGAFRAALPASGPGKEGAVVPETLDIGMDPL